MMEYYTEFPAPAEKDVILNISDVIIHEYDIDKKKHSAVNKLVKEELKLMGGHKSLGTFTGYCVFTRNVLLTRCAERINKFGFPKSKISFKNTVIVIMLLKELYAKTLENIYKPGGNGYNEAKIDFENYCSLPPLPTGKNLYTPIKELSN